MEVSGYVVVLKVRWLIALMDTTKYSLFYKECKKSAGIVVNSCSIRNRSWPLLITNLMVSICPEKPDQSILRWYETK